MNSSRRSIDEVLANCESWLDENSGKSLEDFIILQGISDDVSRELRSYFCNEDFLHELNPTGNANPRTAAVDVSELLPESRESSAPEIEGFNIRKRLGRGGMGEVWEADQTHPMKRQVAIKIIRTDLSDSVPVEIYVDRFRRETDLLAKMEHPNIARVLDAGWTRRGLPFMSMEFIRGIPITLYCDGKRLSVAERLRLFQSVCRAIHHAHQQRILHRDIKPSNILVSEVDGGAHVSVIDFGIALTLEDRMDGTLSAVQSSPAGTLIYMSPEQIQHSNSIDIRSDIFSLGVLLSELLAGRERDTVLSGETVVPSLRIPDDPRQVCGNRSIRFRNLKRILQQELDYVVARACHQSPEHRYQSAVEFEQDVENFLSGKPVTARPNSFVYRHRKLVARYRGRIAFISSLFLLLIFGIAWSRIQWQLSENLRRQLTFRLATSRWNESRPREAIKLIEGVDHPSEPPLEWALARERFQGTRWKREFTHPVAAVDVSPDGRFAAAGLSNGMVVLLDIQGLVGASDSTIRELAKFSTGTNSLVRTVKFSPDGDLILIVANSAQVWNIRTQECLFSLEDPADLPAAFTLQKAEFLSDKSIVGWLASTHDTAASHLIIWNSSTGAIRMRREVSTRITAISVLRPDTVFTGQGAPGASDLVVWKLGARDLVRKQTISSAHKKSIRSVAAESSRLVSLDARSSKVWNVKDRWVLSGKSAFESPISRRIGWLTHVCLSAERLALSRNDGRIVLQDSNANSHELIGHLGVVVQSKFFRQNGRNWLISAGNDRRVRIWDVDENDPTSQVLRTSGGRFNSMGTRVLCIDESRVISATDKLLQLWNLRSGEAEGSISFEVPIQSITGDHKLVYCELINGEIWVVLQGNKKQMSAAREFSTVPNDRQPELERIRPQKTIAYSSSRRLLMSRSASGGVDVRESSADGIRLLRTLACTPETGCILCIETSADGRYVAAGSYSGFVCVWDLDGNSDQPKHVFDCGRSQQDLPKPVQVGCLAFSHDNQWLATGKHNHKIDLWSLKNGQHEQTLKGHEGWLTSLQFNADDTRLFSGAHDGAAKLWDISDGTELLGFHGLENSKVTSVGILPNDAGVLVAGTDGTVRIYYSKRLEDGSRAR